MHTVSLMIDSASKFLRLGLDKQLRQFIVLILSSHIHLASYLVQRRVSSQISQGHSHFILIDISSARRILILVVVRRWHIC